LSVTGEEFVAAGTSGVEEMETNAHERRLYAPGETIYAIQYRKVEWGWHSKNFKRATLESGSRWEVMWGHIR
jgi:hypothetical protein